MVLYRLVRSEFKDDLTGYGAFLYGGRWNSKALYALYCAEHISLAVLEIVVNYDRGVVALMPSYHLLELELRDDAVLRVDKGMVKDAWRTDVDYTRFIGDQFLQSQKGVALQVPSAVVPEECIFLLNPSHTAFKRVKIKSSKIYDLDKRLLG